MLENIHEAKLLQPITAYTDSRDILTYVNHDNAQPTYDNDNVNRQLTPPILYKYIMMEPRAATNFQDWRPMAAAQV